jgi:transposase
LEEHATQAGTAAQLAAAETITVASFERRPPARRPLPAHLPRERIVYPAPAVCACCGNSRGQLLRHESHDTTRIFAKVDIQRLRTLSLPWPGGVR